MVEEKTKKILIGGAILVFCLILIFVLIKIFILKPSPPPPEIIPLPPGVSPESPEAVAIKYLWEEQESKREKTKEYLFPNLSQVEIFGENYLNIDRPLWIPVKKEGAQPEFKVVSSQIKESEASVIIEEITNRRKDFIFFGFPLPEKINFEINLTRFENQWRIKKISSPDIVSRLVFETEIGDVKIEVKENVFIKPIKIEEYLLKDIKPSEPFNKFLFLEAEYENRSAKSVNFSPFAEWRITDENKDFYYPIILKPAFSEVKLDPNNTKKAQIFFEVYDDFSVKEVVFQNLDKKIIFQID